MHVAETAILDVSHRGEIYIAVSLENILDILYCTVLYDLKREKISLLDVTEKYTAGVFYFSSFVLSFPLLILLLKKMAPNKTKIRENPRVPLVQFFNCRWRLNYSKRLGILS